MFGFSEKPNPKSIHDKEPPAAVSSDTPVMSEEDWKIYLDGLSDRMNQNIIKYIQAYEKEFIDTPAQIHLTGNHSIPMERLDFLQDMAHIYHLLYMAISKQITQE